MKRLAMLGLIMGAEALAQEPLRALAGKSGFRVGAAVSSTFWDNNTRYRDVLKREYNVLVAENEMKVRSLQPTQGNFTWQRADELVRFAEENGMKVRGHALVWYKSSAWMETFQAGRNEMLAVLRTHIQTVAGRYKGRIWEWDVVNEAIGDGSETYRDSWLLQRIGPDFIDSAFHYAHRADPAALLYYNDYSAEDMGGKSNKVYNMVKGLLDRGVPIHGVGLQCHFRVESGWPTLANVDRNIKRLHALGLKVSMTEVDWRVPEPADAAMLIRQKQKYQELMAICLANPNCTCFLTWGVTGAALPFNNNYQPKPAYFGMSEALAQRGVGTIPDEFRGAKPLNPSGPPSALRINALGRRTPALAPALSWLAGEGVWGLKR